MILAILCRARRTHLRTPHLAWFSSSLRIQNEQADLLKMQRLLKSEKQIDSDPPRTILKASVDSSIFTAKDTWNAFPEMKFVKPKDLTYKSRSRTLPPYRKKPSVGPPRHVARHTDMFLKLDIDPVRECTNHVLLSHFVTKMGRIMPRKDTGLTTKSQRRLGKAIRRAKMMGVIPILSNMDLHPSIRTTIRTWRRF